MNVVLFTGAPNKNTVNYDLKNFNVLVTPKLFYDEASHAKTDESDAVAKTHLSTKLMQKNSILVKR